MDLSKTIKCPICTKPYKVYAHYCGDQSACPVCREEAEEQIQRPYAGKTWSGK